MAALACPTQSPHPKVRTRQDQRPRAAWEDKGQDGARVETLRVEQVESYEADEGGGESRGQSEAEVGQGWLWTMAIMVWQGGQVTLKWQGQPGRSYGQNFLSFQSVYKI